MVIFVAKKNGKKKKKNNKKKNGTKLKNINQVGKKVNYKQSSKRIKASSITENKENNLEDDFLKLQEKINLKNGTLKMDLTTSSSDAHDSKSEKKENTEDVNISDDVDDLFDVLDTTVKLDDLFLEDDEKKHRNKKLVVGVILSIIILLASFIFLFIVPQVRLKGKRVMVINYKEKYVEPGYRAYFLNKKLTNKVVVTGGVNSSKLGTYKIKYSMGYKGFNNRRVRIVKVKDLSKPVIKLNGHENTSVCPNKEYKEEGYRAYDNYDGDITKKVEVIKNEKFYLYKVSDSNGNKTSIKRNITYEDKVKPVISVNKNIYLLEGEEFKKDYKAYDNCDGDITKNVKVVGSIDTSKAGEYSLKYSVKDSSLNQDDVLQKIHVMKNDAPGTIYLTFDDGPREGTTDVILDILKEENVKATFFVTNGGPDYLIKREYDEGHAIGLHTASHDYKTVYQSVDGYFNDLLSVQNRVKNITGVNTMIIRFPGGSSNTVSRRYQNGIMSILTTEVLNRGYRYYDWNLSSGDAEGGRHDADEIYNNVVNGLSKDRVNMVLMHDIKPYTRDALRNIIQYGKNNGYTFASITDNTQMIKQKVNN